MAQTRPTGYSSFVIRHLEFPLSARQLAGNARVMLARGIHGARKRLEQCLNDMVWFVAVKQFQVQIAPRLVGEALKKFAREAKTKRARCVLIFFRVGDFLQGKFVQPVPDEMRTPAEIYNATCETFIHRYICLAREGIFWMESMAVTTDAALVTQSGGKRLAESNATIFHSVVRVYFQVAVTMHIQVHRGVLGEKREHVIKKRDARFDLRFALAVKVEPDGNLGFERVAFNAGLPFHCGN